MKKLIFLIFSLSLLFTACGGKHRLDGTTWKESMGAVIHFEDGKVYDGATKTGEGFEYEVEGNLIHVALPLVGEGKIVGNTLVFAIWTYHKIK